RLERPISIVGRDTRHYRIRHKLPSAGPRPTEDAAAELNIDPITSSAGLPGNTCPRHENVEPRRVETGHARPGPLRGAGRAAGPRRPGSQDWLGLDARKETRAEAAARTDDRGEHDIPASVRVEALTTIVLRHSRT